MSVIGNQVVIKYQAWNNVLNAGQIGDAANHTLRLIAGDSESTPSGTPVEVDAVNLPGMYRITITAAENLGSIMTLGGISSSANVTITPVSWANDVAVGGLCIGVNVGVEVGLGASVTQECS